MFDFLTLVIVTVLAFVGGGFCGYEFGATAASDVEAALTDIKADVKAIKAKLP